MVPWQPLLINMDPQTKQCNLDTKEKANGSVDFGLCIWKRLPGNFTPLVCKTGLTTPPPSWSCHDNGDHVVNCQHPTCNLSSFCQQHSRLPIVFILQPLQIPALTSVSPFLPGPAEDRCQELLCKCDQEIAYCLAQTKYSLRYLFYPRFLCGQDLLKCDWLAWLDISFCTRK